MIYDYALVEPSLWERRHQPGCPLHNADLSWERPVFRSTSESKEAEERDRRRKWSHDDDSEVIQQSPLTDAEVKICDRLCRRVRSGLNLRLACKQIFVESEDVFWKRNVFCWDDWRAFVHEIKECGTSFNRARISHHQQEEGSSVRRNGLCMPESVKGKVRKVSLLEPGKEVAVRTFEDRESLVEALKGLPSLVEVELPADIVVNWVSDIMGFTALPALKKVKAGWLKPIPVTVAGEAPVRLDLYFSKTFDVPPCCKPGELDYYLQTHHADTGMCEICVGGQCLSCWNKRAELREDAAREWFNPLYMEDDEPSVVERSLKLALEALESKGVPAHTADGSKYVMEVRLEDGEKEKIQVLGLPIRDAQTRKRRREEEEEGRTRRAKMVSRPRAGSQPARVVEVDETVDRRRVKGPRLLGSDELRRRFWW